MSVTIWIEKAQPDYDGCVNLSNTNFRDIMLALDEREAARNYYGTWSGEALTALLLKLRKIRMIEGVLEKPTVTEGNMTSFGRDENYVRLRLSQLIDLVATAIDNNEKVTFG